MPTKARRLCRHPGCSALVSNAEGYCAEHMGDYVSREVRRDRRRGTAQERGYTSKWARYSKRYLAQPEHQLCALRLDAGCAIVAQCVDHIDPPDGGSDPRFWDPSNHQPACIHCNSVKGDRKIKGKV